MNSVLADKRKEAEATTIRPARMVYVVVGGVGFAEALFELIVYWRPTMSPYIEAILDGTFIVSIALPLVYFFVYRPMQRLLNQYRVALDEVKTLRGIIPICAACKNIRTGKESWEKVEAYVRAHTEAEFTHGLCPDCIRKYYPADAQWLIDEISDHVPHIPDEKGIGSVG